jgi:uncharacterized 2Fe-2S/4Fe-4S cluster protein (DUF4445 family)
MDHRITLHRENSPEQEKTVTVPAGTCLSEVAARAGFALRTHCGGAGTCGKCQVLVNNKKVLACQTAVESDLDIFVPASSLRNNEADVVVQLDGSPAERAARRTGHRYGAAVDIGTTTLAAELHDFSGKVPVQTAARPNPQRKFGDDVISRIQKVMENPSALIDMQRLIVEAVNDMTAELSEKAGITPQEISIMVVSGNTVMQSLFFGIDPSPLGSHPFRAPVDTFPPRRGTDIGLAMSPDGTVEAFPIFGGFVGGDIVAGVLTLPKLFLFAAPRFFLDIGTNGEIVLAHRCKLFTAATAAGPCFEGARIQHGILAVPGAIDHVAIESGQITVSTIGGHSPIGICGSGLIDAVAVLLDHKIILPSGRFAEKQTYIELVSATESGIGEAIVLTQRDIRELQLAVGAIRAGITLLLQENDVPPESLETFLVAGGFGQSIRLSSARRIGLLPPLPPDRFQFCGNTSLAGARAMLRYPDNDAVVRRIVEQSEHCELAELPQFQQVFAASMQFAHP